MDIIILCDQIECMHNHKESFVYYGEQNICTFNHPVFYKHGDNRHCTSRCVKYIPNDPCATCEEQEIYACVSCCHKNYYKDKTKSNEQDNIKTK
jgi:hypothetical protein